MIDRSTIKPLRTGFCIAVACLVMGNINIMADCKPFIIDVLFGEPVPFEMMLDDLASVRIIYIGELHTIRRHHEFQKQILRQLAERKLGLALAMEMFAEDHQPILSHWLSSNESVSSLIRDLGKDHWTNLEDYEQVLILARDMRIPIVGLNAADGLVRKVAREGVEGLVDADRNNLPEDAITTNPLNDRLLRLKLQVHKAFKDKSLDRIVLAQSFRDATMARAIIRFLDTSEGNDKILVVIAGTGHLNYGFGIPERVHKKNPLPYRIVLPTESGELVLSEAEKQHALPVTITHQDLVFIRAPIADYLHVLPLKNGTEDSPIEISQEEYCFGDRPAKGVNDYDANSSYR